MASVVSPEGRKRSREGEVDLDLKDVVLGLIDAANVGKLKAHAILLDKAQKQISQRLKEERKKTFSGTVLMGVSSLTQKSEAWDNQSLEMYGEFTAVPSTASNGDILLGNPNQRFFITIDNNNLNGKATIDVNIMFGTVPLMSYEETAFTRKSKPPMGEVKMSAPDIVSFLEEACYQNVRKHWRRNFGCIVEEAMYLLRDKYRAADDSVLGMGIKPEDIHQLLRFGNLKSGKHGGATYVERNVDDNSFTCTAEDEDDEDDEEEVEDEEDDGDDDDAEEEEEEEE